MPNKKVFVDDTPVAEKVEVVEEPKAKPKRKRKPLTEEQKKALVERLAKARAAKKNARAGTSEPKETKPKATRKKKSPIKPSPSDNGAYQKKQHELADLRHQMEIQKLRNELDDLKKPRKSKAPIVPMETIKEDSVVEDKPKQSVSEIKEVNNSEPIENSPPIQETPKTIRRNLANKGDIWNMIRNS